MWKLAFLRSDHMYYTLLIVLNYDNYIIVKSIQTARACEYVAIDDHSIGGASADPISSVAL